MVHTLPDGTTKYRMVTIFGQIDSGELAARLGSIVTFDRRGNVVFLEDFEGCTLHWKTGTFGANGALALVTDWGKTGSQSCKFTAGDGVGGMAWLFRYLGTRVLGKLGVEASFTVDADTKAVYLELRYYDGTNYYGGIVKYDHVNEKFQVNDNTLGYTDVLTSSPLEDTLGTFHDMKLVVDSDTKKYVRMIINNQSVDISAYTLKKTASATHNSLYCSVLHASDHASAKSIWVDNIIITQNEP